MGAHKPIGLAPRHPAGDTPVRTPGSVRRTSTIDTLWPGARFERTRLTGRARDIFTPIDGGAPIVRAEDGFAATLGGDRTIAAIKVEPSRAAVAQLVGERGGGHLRKVLAELLPDELHGASPLYLLLDYISGASLVAGWAWSQWIDDWLTQRSATMTEEAVAAAYASRIGICVGFAPDASSLANGPRREISGALVPDLRNSDDPEGWHAFADQSGAVGMRRARRIDVSLANGQIEVSSHFQDSASTPDGGRMGLHEYLITATVDADTMELTSIDADPRILPFPECPAASRNLQQLVGSNIAALRQLVLERLRGTAGCTHLNDAVRALAEVPALAGYLREQAGRS